MRATWYECPRCIAEAGRPCIDEEGKELNLAHESRATIAAAHEVDRIERARFKAHESLREDRIAF